MQRRTIMQTSMLAACLAASLGACGTNSGDDEEVDCSKVTGTDTFVVGLDHHGTNGTLDFQLMNAIPSPPARDDNTWTVQINTMSAGVVGSPVDSADLTVTPFMPSHQHGSPKRVTVTPVPGMTGQFTLSPVNLWMPGVWETTIKATAGSTMDSAVYKFCIE